MADPRSNWVDAARSAWRWLMMVMAMEMVHLIQRGEKSGREEGELIMIHGQAGGGARRY